MSDVAALLGAGASRDAGLPTTGEMTKVLASHFQGGGRSDARNVLHFVAGQLLGYEGVQRRSPFDDLDIESVMTAIELLGERRNLELAPFVFAWHPTVNELEVPDFHSPHLIRDIKTAIATGLSSRESRDTLEQPLARFIRKTARIGTDDGAVFRRAFEDLQGALISVLSSHWDTSYLRPIFELCPLGGWLVIATLNYDLTVEAEARAVNVTLDNGVESWAESGDWQWPSDGVRLLKLHGSIDWEGQQSHDEPLRQYRVTVSHGHRPRSPAVIFGGRNKLRAAGPFLELLAQFEFMLRAAQHY